MRIAETTEIAQICSNKLYQKKGSCDELHNATFATCLGQRCDLGTHRFVTTDGRLITSCPSVSMQHRINLSVCAYAMQHRIITRPNGQWGGCNCTQSIHNGYRPVKVRQLRILYTLYHVYGSGDEKRHTSLHNHGNIEYSPYMQIYILLICIIYTIICAKVLQVMHTTCKCISEDYIDRIPWGIVRFSAFTQHTE